MKTHNHSFSLILPWFRRVVVATALFLPTVAGHSAEPAVEVDVLIVPYRQVSVSFPVGGIVEEIAVREGDLVQRGALLATLEHLEEALDTERFEKALEKRRSDHDASDQLFREKMISEEEALEKRVEMEIAEIQVKRAAAAVERRKLRSPLAGLVVGKHREPGEWVDPGTVVLEIVDIDQVYAQLMLRAEHSRGIRMGQDIPLVFPDVSGSNQFTGKVDFIDPRIDAASGLLRVRVLIDNPGHRLPPGMSGLAQLPR